jgi:flagellar basal body L-ring protein FlgH
MSSLSGNQVITVCVHYMLYFGVLVIAGHIVMACNQTMIAIVSKGLIKIIERRIGRNVLHSLGVLPYYSL